MFVEMLPDMMTDEGYGPHRRIRVDVGQTGFFAGREFRVFEEFSISSGQSQVWKFNATAVQFILQHLACQLWDADARFEVMTEGGTEIGSFLTTVTQRRTNRMTTADLTYASQMVVTTGGGYSGGIVTEVAELTTATGAGHHHEAASDMRQYGVPIGLYYVKVTAIGGTARGAINVRWEERP